METKKALADKAERFLITQPTEWVEAFKAQAKKENMSLSEWIGECCIANCPKYVVRQLPKRRTRGK